MIIKVHYNAVKHLQKILDKSTSEFNVLRITSGCSWSGIHWNIVLDEQKDDDIIAIDKGFKIAIQKDLAATISVATIQYKKTFAGYKFMLT